MKKYGISSELAQKMMDEAMAKAREIGVTENVAILDDGGNFIQGDPSLLAGIPTLARLAAYGEGFPIEVNSELVGAIGVSGAPSVQNDVDCARAALALVSDAVPGGLNS